MLSKALIALPFLVMMACSTAAGKSGEGLDFDAGVIDMSDDESGTPESSQPSLAFDDPLCAGLFDAASAPPRGIADFDIYSDGLGGLLPVSFEASCNRTRDVWQVVASDGLSTLRAQLDSPQTGAQFARGSLTFEDLAAFEGTCRICMDASGGALSCSSLIWQSDEDSLVKASVKGSFSCETP